MHELQEQQQKFKVTEVDKQSIVNQMTCEPSGVEEWLGDVEKEMRRTVNFQFFECHKDKHINFQALSKKGEWIKKWPS